MGAQPQINAISLQSAISKYDIMSGSGYLQSVEEGVSGQSLKQVVELIDDRELFSRILGKDKSNLSRSFKVKQLPKMVSDNIIDTTRILIQAINTYDSYELANEWIRTSLPILGGRRPIDMMDSHAGRNMIRETLHKIEQGDYS